jgi:hypothetical protein
MIVRANLGRTTEEGWGGVGKEMGGGGGGRKWSEGVGRKGR